MTTFEQNKMMDDNKEMMPEQPGFREDKSGLETIDVSSKKSVGSAENFQDKLGGILDQEFEGNNMEKQELELVGLDKKSKGKVDNMFKPDENGRNDLYKNFAQLVNARYPVVKDFKDMNKFREWFNNLPTDLQDSYYQAYEEGMLEKKWMTPEEAKYLKQKLGEESIAAGKGKKVSYFNFKDPENQVRYTFYDPGNKKPVVEGNGGTGLTDLEQKVVQSNMQKPMLDTMSGTNNNKPSEGNW